jgi:uncharacterized damage-inducible protein DinB
VREEPAPGLGGEREHLAAFLDFYRATVVAKCRSLGPTALRESRVPTGWTPLELLDHLAHMERRWVVWGFLAEPVPDPWGDGEERWHTGRDLDAVVAMLDDVAARTAAVLATTPLEAPAATGGRFATADEAPDLRWICFHVLQEYARHAGHLDVAVEIAGGHVGE